MQSHIPKAPRGIGFSKKFIASFIVLLTSITVIFLFFLHHYSHNAKRIEKTPQEIAQPAEDWIRKIQEQPIEKKTKESVSLSLSDQMPDNEFQAGGNAQISVYHDATPSLAPASSQNQPGNLPSTQKTSDAYSSQNQQSEKTAFLQSGGSQKDYIASALKQPVSPYEIKAGTIIPATLMTGINSDLPGTIIAKVRRNVFDTATGNYLLIPQGTMLTGIYDSQIAYGQSRALIVWQRLIFPNSYSFDLEGMLGADLAGMAGLHDLVDNHYLKLFGSALMFSLFGAAGQLSQPRTAANELTTQQIIYAAIGQQMNQTGAQLAAKNMNIQPTIKIRPGTNFNVLLTRDMVLPSPYHF